MSDPISKFFVDYPQEHFPDAPELDLTLSSTDWRQQGAFDYLHRHLRWTQTQRDNAYVELETARFEFVVELFGHEKSEDNYRELCADLEILPLPANKTQLERELRRIHVNLVDVIQYRWDKRLGRGTSRVTKYRNSEEAKNAARDEHKSLSAEIGKIGVLRVLLR